MLFKIALFCNCFSLFVFAWIHATNYTLPSVQTIVSAMQGPAGGRELFVAFAMFVFACYPFYLTTCMFVHTGKYLYMEMSDLMERFKIFIRTFVCHFAIVSVLHMCMTYTMMTYDESIHFKSVGLMREIAYTNGMYSYLITIFSTSLKIPLFAFLIEIFLIADYGIPVKPVLRKSALPLMLCGLGFMFSFAFEYRSDNNFISYMQNTYYGYTPTIDTLTDTSYSILMFACLYSSVLNYYRVW